MRYRILVSVAVLLTVLSGGFSVYVISCMRSEAELSFPVMKVKRTEFVDRFGIPLTRTYENDWNIDAQLDQTEIPVLLLQSILLSEDQRFYKHGGVDWRARGMALFQNLQAGRIVRGASTITEQVVRMAYPRPRTLLSRLIEHGEARRLEARYSKDDILNFYVNQVPYGRRIRGIEKAARKYFGRALSTLHPIEMLMLAVMIRAPSSLAPDVAPEALQTRVQQLAKRMHVAGFLSVSLLEEIEDYQYQKPLEQLAVEAPHVIRALREQCLEHECQAIEATTIDAALQSYTERMLNQRVDDLSSFRVRDAAALVVDHQRNEIRAWANAGTRSNDTAYALDAVQALRQPGSTLKPFIYAETLVSGWTAATLVRDAPLIEGVGSGQHSYQNYSGLFYGPLRLRNALGNSLNTPAVRAIQYAGVPDVLRSLHALGFTSLKRGASFYGDGLALGNGEVTLYELVSAYATLARGGVRKPLTLLQKNVSLQERRLYREEVTALITDILSDPGARALEFSGGMLNFPGRIAVKTGTSNDFRDAWALGYSGQYTVGVWMGNLDRSSMDGISGTKGPALVVRALFQKLQDGPARTLPRTLVPETICAESGLLPAPDCPHHGEYFLPETVPKLRCKGHTSTHSKASISVPEFITPTRNLRMVMDPRIPDDHEQYEFSIRVPESARDISWYVNQQLVARGHEPFYRWPLQRGIFTVQARVSLHDGSIYEIPSRKIFVR